MNGTNNMIGKPEEIIKWLFNQERDKLFEIKEHKAKRSLNANSYCWALIGEIANVLRTSKDEIYLLMLKRYGQSEIISVRSDVDVKGFIKYYEVVGQGVVNGKEFNHIKVFKGSSEYDTKEMAILIDGIVSEAEELGIETLPPNEVERLKNLW